MKKSIILSLAAAVAVSTVSAAFAAENSDPLGIHLSGGITLQDRVQRDNNNAGGTVDNTKTGLKTTFLLNADKNLTKNLDMYARLTYQTYSLGTSVNGKLFYSDTISDDYNGAIDAVGLKYTNAGIDYTLGSQALTLGRGLIYDNGFIGKHALPYALKIDGKAGATNLTFIGAKTNYQSGAEDDKFYAIQGNYDISKKANIGGMFAHVSYGSATLNNEFQSPGTFNIPYSSANFWGINGAYQLTDKWSAAAEFVKSDADNDNIGYMTGVSYKIDRKNTIGLQYFRVEDQANIVDANRGGMTTAPYNNTKGYSISWKDQIGKNVSLTVADFKYDKINAASNFGGANSDRERFTTTVAVTF